MFFGLFCGASFLCLHIVQEKETTLLSVSKRETSTTTTPPTNKAMQTPPPPTITTTTTTTTAKDYKTTTLYLLATSLFSLLFLLSLSKLHSPTPSPPSDPFLFPNPLFSSSSDQTHNPLPPNPPAIAYLISGSTNDSGRILRLLFSIYHPKNTYLLHLDRSATQTDRDSLALTVQSVPIFRAANNVNVIGKPDFSYPKGSSLLSSTLRGASILLRVSESWDWFINLSAADYPLVTQDGICVCVCIYSVCVFGTSIE